MCIMYIFRVKSNANFINSDDNDILVTKFGICFLADELFSQTMSCDSPNWMEFKCLLLKTNFIVEAKNSQIAWHRI